MSKDQLRAQLNGMSKDELLDLIKSKGEARKRTVFDSAQFQTTDYELTSKLVAQLGLDRAQVENERAEYVRMYESRKQALNDARAANQKANQDLIEKEAALSDLKNSKTTSKKQRNICMEEVDNVTSDMVKQVNRVLYSDQPDLLINGIEAFVAILRNKMDANNVDVELFFKKYENLVAKMRRMEMRDMNEQVVRVRGAECDKLIRDWEATSGSNKDQDYSELACLLRWAKTFCEGSLIELDLKNQEDAVEQARKEVTKSASDMKKYERLVNEIEQNQFTNFHDSVLDSFGQLQERIEGVQDRDRQQAEANQNNFNYYDKNYFEQYVRIASGKTNDVTQSRIGAGGRFSLLSGLTR